MFFFFLGGGGGGGKGGGGVKIRKKIRNRFDPVTFYEFIVELAEGERDIVVTTLVRCMCVHASVWIYPGINFYIYALISK